MLDLEKKLAKTKNLGYHEGVRSIITGVDKWQKMLVCLNCFLFIYIFIIFHMHIKQTLTDANLDKEICIHEKGHPRRRGR